MDHGCTSNRLHSVKPSLGYCSFTHLNPWDTVILRRLRIGHTRLTHQYLLRQEEPPQCPSCNCALTVVRIILECQQYNSVRQKYFSVTTLKELFDRVNFDDICSKPVFYAVCIVRRHATATVCVPVIPVGRWPVGNWFPSLLGSCESFRRDVDRRVSV